MLLIISEIFEYSKILLCSLSSHIVPILYLQRGCFLVLARNICTLRCYLTPVLGICPCRISWRIKPKFELLYPASVIFCNFNPVQWPGLSILKTTSLLRWVHPYSVCLLEKQSYTEISGDIWFTSKKSR